MAKKNTKKKFSMPKHMLLGIILAIAFLVSAAALVICCIFLGMIPITYILIFAMVAIALAEGILFANRWKISGIIVNVISCILIFVMLAGCYYVNITKKTVQNVQAGDYTTVYIGVYVLDEDEAQELEDTADYEFAYDTLFEEDATQQAIEYVEETLSAEIDLSEYSSMYEMIDDIESGSVQAIIIGESYLQIAEEVDGYEWIEDGLRQIERIEIKIEKETALADDEDEDIDSSDLGSFVIYISGIDSYGDVSVTSRSDVNILAVVNTETKKIALITTPRDYYVTYAKTNGAYDKLTHAGLYGIDQSEDALEGLYGVEIDYYVRMNFTGFENIIDALGGITVYSEYSFSSAISDYSYVAGYNTLDGEAALYFARERKSFSDGDFQRGRNQMAVIEAILDKLVSLSTLANYQAIMDAISDSFETDMSTSMINAIIQMQLSYGGSWDVESYQVTGKTGSATTYSAGSQYLSVVFQDADSIQEACDLINQTLYPELFETEETDEEESETE